MSRIKEKRFSFLFKTHIMVWEVKEAAGHITSMIGKQRGKGCVATLRSLSIVYPLMIPFPGNDPALN